MKHFENQKNYLMYQRTLIEAAANPLLTPSEEKVFSTIYELYDSKLQKPCWIKTGK